MAITTIIPIAVGDVYLVGSIARLKLTISFGGTPVDGQTPSVTIVRDCDNNALNFTLGAFVTFSTPGDLDLPVFKSGMTELGQGTYFFDFDPTAFATTTEQVFTVIFRNEDPSFLITAHNEFHFSVNSTQGTGTGFGAVDRYLSVCLEEPTVIAYQANSGQTDVKISIYSPFDALLVSNATMKELNSTGIYRHTFIATLEGDYVMTMSEDTNGSRDALILTAGGDCDRLKRVESLLNDLALNPPTVGPCV